MTIKKKLFAIGAFLGLLAIVAVFAVLQVGKGARFHVYNLRHTTLNSELDAELIKARNGNINTANLKSLVPGIREQPIACLREVNFMDKAMMRIIDTYPIISICELDLKQGTKALEYIENYKQGKMDAAGLITALEQKSDEYRANGKAFEAPVIKTVSFISITMTVLIIIVALVAVVNVFFLARSILRPLNLVRNRITDIAAGEGDLRLRVGLDTPDELG